MYLSVALARAGCRVTALCSWPSGRSEPPVETGVAVARLAGPADGWRRSLVFAFKAAWWLATHWREWDVVHVHGWCWAATLVPILGKPCLYKTAIPGDDDPGTIRRTRGGWGKRLLVGCYDRYPSISELVTGMLAADGIEPWRIAAIPNGVEERFRPGTTAQREAARARILPAHGFPPETLLVLCVGSLEHRKGTDILARAWPTVSRGAPTARLLMVGPHDLADPFLGGVTERLGDHLGRTAVMAGRVDDPLDLYQAADVFVFPSRNESFGNVLVEAMACGLPCVAADIAGVTGGIVTGGADGIVVPPEDPDALGRALASLLADGNLRSHLGEAAAQTVDERFRIDRAADAYLAVYREMLAEG